MYGRERERLGQRVSYWTNGAGRTEDHFWQSTVADLAYLHCALNCTSTHMHFNTKVPGVMAQNTAQICGESF